MLRLLRKYAQRAVLTALFAPVAIAMVKAARPPATSFFRGLAEWLFDSNYAWCTWIGIGIIIGAWAHSSMRRMEETSRGAIHGPSVTYLRWEIRALRWAIASPAFRRVSPDFDKDLVDLDHVLQRNFNFPPLPCTKFADTKGISETAEYLRRVAPHLSSRHMETAKAAAIAYVKEISPTKQASSKVPRDTKKLN